VTRRVEIDGELLVEGEGLAARLTGHGATVRVEVGGRLAGGGHRRRDLRRMVPAAAARLEQEGVRLVARDTAGRRLGEAGAGVRSRLGLVAIGTRRVRPSLRLMLRVLARR
jgi:hypothetical protein